jgi:hypothetical protein
MSSMKAGLLGIGGMFVSFGIATGAFVFCARRGLFSAVATSPTSKKAVFVAMLACASAVIVGFSYAIRRVSRRLRPPRISGG